MVPIPGHGPNHHGFDSSYGGLTGAVGAYDHRYRLTTPYAVTWHRNHEIIPDYENGRHVTDLVTEEAVRVIEQPREDPFFLYLAYFAPHTPLDERGKFADVPTQRDPARPDRWLNEDDIEWFHDPLGKIQQEADPEKRLFLAVVHHLDHAIGQVVAALERSGQRDNTVILFSSDNGPQVNWGGNAYPADLKLTDFNQPIPFRGSKSQVYEGGMRVPGIVNWPGKIAPCTLDTPQHIIDWIPTVAGLIGAEAQVPAGQPALDGQDFSSRLLGQSSAQDASPRDIYALHRRVPNKWALRYGDWKIVAYTKQQPTVDQWQLFQLRDDIAEETDLASRHPEKVRELHARFMAIRAHDRAGYNVPEYEPPESN